MPFFSLSEQTRVHFQVVGEGPDLVLLHGFGEDHRIWQPLVDALEGYRLVLIDLPAFGKSDRLPEPSIEGFAQAVQGVLDHLRITTFHLMGHSMGGYTSLALMEEQPERVLTLGMIHSHPYADTEEKKRNRAKSMEFVEKNGAAPYLKQLYTALFPREYLEQHPDLIPSLIDRALPWGEAPILAGLDAMRKRPDRSQVIAKFPRPVLFLSGDLDLVVPENYRLLQPLLAQVGSTHQLRDIGHMSMIEDPALFVQIIRNFLQTATSLL
ncbi:MAG: alpha/beta hydrolase [Bacteroidota bacterium]